MDLGRYSDMTESGPVGSARNEPVAVVAYMGVEAAVWVGTLGDDKPVFYRLEPSGEKLEIRGDAATDNHYLALAAEYGASMVRRPDPVAAKADMVRLFGEKAVQMGVPLERGAEAGEAMFASMVRVTSKIKAEHDRELRRCHIPVPKRGEPDAELVQWLDAMPESARQIVIANNIRAYVPLYEPDPEPEPEVLVLELSSTSSAAFDDIGRLVEASRIIREVADTLVSGTPVTPVTLYDTNGNAVGSLAMMLDLPSVDHVPDGSIRLTLNTSLLSDRERGEAVSSAVREAASRLLDQTHDQVMFLVAAPDGKTLGSVIVNEPCPVEFIQDSNVDSLSI